MAARQIVVPGAMPSRDANGRSLPAKLRFYAPGTTTPKAVYTNDALTVAHGFPIVSDSAGRFPPVWAEETEFFDVGWTDQEDDAAIETFTNVRPVHDALLISASMADAAAEDAEAAKVLVEAYVAQFGSLSAAIAAAQAAQFSAMGYASAASGSAGVALEAVDDAQEAAANAEMYALQAQQIAGFDPATYLTVSQPQAFTDPQKAQARANIGAAATGPQMQDVEKVSRPSIVGGVLTLDLAAAPVFEVQWNANITSVVLQGVPAGTDATSWTLILVAAGGTSFTPGSAFKAMNNQAPALSTVAGDYNFLTMQTRNAGARVDYSFGGFTR